MSDRRVTSSRLLVSDSVTTTHHVLDAAVLALRVLSDGDQVNVGVRGLVPLHGDTRSYVGVEVEGLPQQQVHGGVTCSDGRLQGSCGTKAGSAEKNASRGALPHGRELTFQSDLALVHRLLSIRRNHPSAPRTLNRRHIPLLPFNWSLQVT